MVLATAHFGFLGVQDISNTPKIISPFGKSQKMVFNLVLCYNGFSSLSYFSLFLPYSLYFPPKNFFFGKCSVLIGSSFFSNLWASWMVLAASHFDF